MISDALALIDFLKKNWEHYKTVSALFKWDGTKVEGDDKIAVVKIQVKGSRDKWFFRIRPVDGYVFVYMPLIPSVVVDNGTLGGEKNPDADLFRFVGNLFSSVISGGNPNVKADFLVVGYKPKDLLRVREES